MNKKVFPANIMVPHEQGASQLLHTPRSAEGDAFVAHAEDIQPHIPEPENELKRDLWQQIVDGHRASGVSQTVFARQLGTFRQRIAMLEQQGSEALPLNLLHQYAQSMEGWAEPITGPAPLGTSEQEKAFRQREQNRAAAQRWREQHPEISREKARVRAERRQRLRAAAIPKSDTDEALGQD